MTLDNLGNNKVKVEKLWLKTGGESYVDLFIYD